MIGCILSKVGGTKGSIARTGDIKGWGRTGYHHPNEGAENPPPQEHNFRRGRCLDCAQGHANFAPTGGVQIEIKMLVESLGLKWNVQCEHYD